MLTFHEYFPFFQAFFSELGFSLLLSPPTNAEIVRGAFPGWPAPPLPYKVAHGHAAWMKEAVLGSKAGAMLIPSLRETFPTAEAHPYANLAATSSSSPIW